MPQHHWGIPVIKISFSTCPRLEQAVSKIDSMYKPTSPPAKKIVANWLFYLTNPDQYYKTTSD